MGAPACCWGPGFQGTIKDMFVSGKIDRLRWHSSTRSSPSTRPLLTISPWTPSTRLGYANARDSRPNVWISITTLRYGLLFVLSCSKPIGNDPRANWKDCTEYLPCFGVFPLAEQCHNHCWPKDEQEKHGCVSSTHPDPTSPSFQFLFVYFFCHIVSPGTRHKFNSFSKRPDVNLFLSQVDLV